MSDNLPASPYSGGSGPPARRLSSQELEAVIRRAHELQTTRADREDGLSEAEVIQIGKELGLSTGHVRQALAEVATPKPPAEAGTMTRMMGPSVFTASRAVPGDARQVREQIEQYLLEVECMEIVRRHPGGRTQYRRGQGIGATLRRATSQLNSRSRFAQFKLQEVTVEVQPLETGFSLVTLGADLGTVRAAMLATGGTMGGVGGTAAAGFLGVAVDPLAALLGIPILAGGYLFSRMAYGSVTGSTANQMEAFLDRVQHGELHVPTAPDWRKKLGF